MLMSSKNRKIHNPANLLCVKLIAVHCWTTAAGTRTGILGQERVQSWFHGNTGFLR